MKKYFLIFNIIFLFAFNFNAYSSNVINTISNDSIMNNQSQYLSEEKAEEFIHKESFNTKEELYDYFYTYFYNYILYSGGESFLKQNNINNLDDFLLLNKTWTGGAKGMKEVGDICGIYFLTKDTGGQLKDQINKPGFIGFCLKNNILPDFINFLQEFFYYWRLDENYTDFSHPVKKYGSDFLASPSSSAIDTAKFFYFDKNTLPDYFYPRKHIPEMYDKIPYIIHNKN